MKRIQNWPRARIRVLAALTVLSAAVISFSSVQHLAESHGFGWLSWIFPLCFDAVAGFGLDLWVTRSRAWKGAAALALFAIACSLLANAKDHFDTAASSVDAGLAAGLGALPPFMLACLMAVLHTHGAAPGIPDRGQPVHDIEVIPPVESAPPVRLEPEPPPIEPVTESASEQTQIMEPVAPHRAQFESKRVTAPLRKNTRRPTVAGTRRNKSAAEIAAGESPEATRRELMTRHGIGTTKATEVLRILREGQVS